MAIPCNRHPNFSGLRLGRKASECPDCVAYYKARKAAGDKESRNRGPNKAKAGTIKVGDPSEGLVATKEDIEAALASKLADDTETEVGKIGNPNQELTPPLTKEEIEANILAADNVTLKDDVCACKKEDCVDCKDDEVSLDDIQDLL